MTEGDGTSTIWLAADVGYARRSPSFTAEMISAMAAPGIAQQSEFSQSQELEKTTYPRERMRGAGVVAALGHRAAAAE